jgi:uncharacterized membrane protein (GlpM family)
MAKANKPFLAGLLVLFPAVTLVSFSFLAKSSSPETMHRIALFSIYSFPATLTFLVAFFLAQQRLGSGAGLCLALVAWLVTASLLALLNTRVLHI